jgi:hypothetical protein
MADLSPLRPVLVMLLFLFIMGVIRLYSFCEELDLLSSEYMLPWRGVMTPVEDKSDKLFELIELCDEVW